MGGANQCDNMEQKPNAWQVRTKGTIFETMTVNILFLACVLCDSHACA